MLNGEECKLHSKIRNKPMMSCCITSIQGSSAFSSLSKRLVLSNKNKSKKLRDSHLKGGSNPIFIHRQYNNYEENLF
jgi:hypothetical protein